MDLIKVEQATWKIGSLTILVLLSLPVISILSNINRDFFKDILNALTQSYTLNTAILMLGVGLLSLIMGVSTAWLCSRYKFPFSSFFNWALILPLAVPSYIMAYTYKGMFGLFGTSHALFNFYIEIDNIWALCFIMAISLYPYVYLTSRVSFMLSSNRFIESSFSLGKNIFTTFLKIVLPLSWPAIFGGLVLVLMEVVNNYGAVQYFGIQTFTTEIVRKWNPLNSNSIQSVASILILFVAIFYFIEKSIRKGAGFAEKIGKSKETSYLVLSGKNRAMAFLLCLVVFCFAFLLPVGQLLYWSLGKWNSLFTGDLAKTILVTFIIGISAALLSTLVALFIRYFIHHGRKIKVLIWLNSIPSLGYSVPGALLGVGILSFLMYLSRAFNINLTSSIGILIFAYLVRFYSVSMGTLNGGFEKIQKNLGHASFSLGKSFSGTLTHIHFPLLKNVLFASMILVFVDVVKELPLTMMFQSFNFQTLAVKSYMMMETDGAVYNAALPSLLIVLISVVPVYFVNRWVK